MSGKQRRRGRKPYLTEEFWAELRELYESGDYSQRDLVAFAKARGINVSQSLIARKAQDQDWVKGTRLKQLKEQIRAEIAAEVGDQYRQMLEQHQQQARLLEAEVLAHFKEIQERRKIDPHAVIPAGTLNQLSVALDRANLMRARAIGFDYRSGEPFKSGEKDDENKLDTLRLEVMSEEEERRVRERVEKAAQGEFGDIES